MAEDGHLGGVGQGLLPLTLTFFFVSCYSVTLSAVVVFCLQALHTSLHSIQSNADMVYKQVCGIWGLFWLLKKAVARSRWRLPSILVFLCPTRKVYVNFWAGLDVHAGPCCERSDGLPAAVVCNPSYPHEGCLLNPPWTSLPYTCGCTGHVQGASTWHTASFHPARLSLAESSNYQAISCLINPFLWCQGWMAGGGYQPASLPWAALVVNHPMGCQQLGGDVMKGSTAEFWNR